MQKIREIFRQATFTLPEYLMFGVSGFMQLSGTEITRGPQGPKREQARGPPDPV